jgi:uncharacterized protein with PIN domain
VIVDTSALVAILRDESDAAEFAKAIASAVEIQCHRQVQHPLKQHTQVQQRFRFQAFTRLVLHAAISRARMSVSLAAPNASSRCLFTLDRCDAWVEGLSIRAT